MKLLVCTQTVDRDDPILGFFHRWLIEFAAHFEQIHVICLREGVHDLPTNVNVYSLGKENGESRLKYIWKFYRYFYNIFIRERVDFVFFHMGAIYNILAAPFFLVRKLYETRFFWWKTHGKLNFAGKIALAFVDEVVTAGAKSFNASSRKIRTVGHAVDTEAIPVKGSYDETCLKILSVGRIVPIKKLEIALEITGTYLEKTGRSFQYDIFGPTTDLFYKKELDKSIDENKLNRSVLFRGELTHELLRNQYQFYDVLLHPSYEAGFDKVVLEAMAAGILPLTSIRSFESVLAPFGLYISANDIEGYVNALTKIHSMNSYERKSLGVQLREIVERNHSITTLCSRIFRATKQV